MLKQKIDRFGRRFTQSKQNNGINHERFQKKPNTVTKETYKNILKKKYNQYEELATVLLVKVGFEKKLVLLFVAILHNMFPHFSMTP